MHDIHRKFPVLIGVKVFAGVKIIKEKGFSYRIARQNGKYHKLGNSFDSKRVNLYIDDLIITCYSFF